MNNKEIKERIKFLRERKCTQRDAANALGISVNTYVAIESGATTIVNPRLSQLAALLERSEMFILTGTEPMSHNLEEADLTMQKCNELTQFYEEKLSENNSEIEKLKQEVSYNKNIVEFLLKKFE